MVHAKNYENQSTLKLCRKKLWPVFLPDTVYRAHRAVIFSIAQLSCYLLGLNQKYGIHFVQRDGMPEIRVFYCSQMVISSFL